ncbi:histone-fold-containing protein [Calocera cornea HHB12733]|uniref:Histone-fold-containing protein n=1 Tax=Calocera cornea HHB12733 TaxID=1353952 RepID=A0A165DEN2_9BASI|nr:histone-fold-containing protein [Calocera cornea HHB12733]
MSDHPPLAPQEGSGVEPAQYALSTEPHVFTEQELGEYREQDRFLPIANVARIMKSSLPPNAKIAKDAKETVQECVSEFISFITSEAAEKCHLEKRKTVVGEDIIYALYSLGFENYAEVLKVLLARMRHAHSLAQAHKKSASGEFSPSDPSELALQAHGSGSGDDHDDDADEHDDHDEDHDEHEGDDDNGVEDAEGGADDELELEELEERFKEVVEKGRYTENEEDES